jgi:ketosteroid isomerase-like protein
MSQDNVETVRRGFEGFTATGELRPERFHPEFVWDMSTFRGWPEQQTYDGLEGAQKFLGDWLEAWDDWELEPEEYLDAGGDKVVVIMRQRGRAKATGVTIEMHFAQVWTFKDGLQVRMQMYASPAEAIEATGLGGQTP